MDLKNKFTYMLAPLEDMTDSCFRTIAFRHGVDLTFTELIRIESLAKNNKSTWERLKLYDDTPTIIQLIGHKEQFLKKFLSTFSPEKNFSGFNLNLGCPAPNFVNTGMGCAMVKRVSKTKTIIDIIKDAGYPASIKMRLGLNAFEKERKAYLNIIDAVNADFFVVHARHGGQSYKDSADRSVYPDCVKSGKIIIANGDVKSMTDIEELKALGCHGAMIGRAAISDPQIFAKLKGLSTTSLEEIKKEYEALCIERNSPFRYRQNIFKNMKLEN